MSDKVVLIDNALSSGRASHADRLLQAVRIERAVVDVLNNLREGLKREIQACAI